MSRDTKDRNDGMNRRQFLGTTGGGLFFLGAVGSGVSQLLSACELHGEIPRIAGQSRSFITPTDGPLGNDFYITFGRDGTTVDNHPVISNSDWFCQITGEVDEDVTITYAELTSIGQTESVLFLKTMRCVFDAPADPLTSNAYWRGVPLKRFLEQAGPSADAKRLFITGSDGFQNNLRLARVLDDVAENYPDGTPVLPVMLCYEMNGQPIPSVHGGPVRIVVPEKFGYKNMKWPELIEVTESDRPFGDYEVELFSNNATTDIGNIAITSVFTGPADGEAVSGPRVTFFGFAVDGPGEIDSVEVAIDGGAFVPAEVISLEQVLADPNLFFGDVTDENAAARQAELDAVVAELVQVRDARFASSVPWVWSLWTVSFELSSGQHSAEVRATSTSGATQPERDTDSADGNSQIRQIRFTVS